MSLQEEKTIKKKSTNKIKEEAYNVNIPYFKFTKISAENKLITIARFKSQIGGADLTKDSFEASKVISAFFPDYTGSYGVGDDKLIDDSTIIPFFYSTGLNIFLLQIAPWSSILNYFNGLKNKFRYIFNMNVVEQRLVDIIEAVDEHTIDIATLQSDRDSNKKYNLNPRVKRLLRLKNINNFIIETFLTMLHLFFWVDFQKLQSNTKNINEYVNKAIKICFVLKDLLYKELDEEYPTDLIQKTIDQAKLKK